MSVLQPPKPKKKKKKTVRWQLPEDLEKPKPKELSYLQRAYLRNVLRTNDMFLSNYGANMKPPTDFVKYRMSLKATAEYSDVKDIAHSAPRAGSHRKRKPHLRGPPSKKRNIQAKSGLALPALALENIQEDPGTAEQIATNLVVQDAVKDVNGPKESNAVAKYQALPAAWKKTGGDPGRSVVLHRPKRIKPVWHPPWKIYKVLSGHQGWVRCVDVDISNEMFVTGSADRTIKIWDLASGDLKLTLTGHTDHVRGVKLSPRHPYLFSCGLDQTVRCWDLTMNKVIRNYHGHLSGVLCLDVHPELEVIMTGGRDAVCRVWDIRTKAQIFTLSGHKDTISSVATQVGAPAVVTGSHDKQIRCWDLSMGKASSVLTHHKKSIRSLFFHPEEYTFCSGSGDNIKVWKCPEGRFVRNFEKKPPSITNAMCINADNVVATGHDTGQLMFWDWKTGHCFQETFSTPQAGSIESEAGIQAMAFDRTGSRLITVETDKSIKIWKEDENATQETHPVKYKGKLRRVKSVY